MKLISIGLLLGVLVVLPLMLLQAFVLPELQAMKNLYGSVDQISSDVVKQRQTYETTIQRVQLQP